MQSLRPSVLRAARRQNSALNPSKLRLASTSIGPIEGQSRAESNHDHVFPAEESLGTSFYIVIALIPLSYGVYLLARPSTEGVDPPLTRLMNYYSDYNDSWVRRNTLHTKMIEQAAFDRNLFQSSPGSKVVELRFPEIFNSGSPYNVSAGQGVNLDKLIAHYEKQNRENEERKLRVLAERQRK
ncbi:MAG: hypothetical protein M1829_002408 [Trizodia sp. TS-e1964]|nr:MAG: hypothetical protein M1829_002408 [Trizodia sp. TS-e1964]